MVITHSEDTLTVKDGNTVYAELDLQKYYQNNDETIDEAVFHALKNLQAQLMLTAEPKEVDDSVACAASILIDRIRAKKKHTASYREHTFSY
jgi:hypothetical protein